MSKRTKRFNVALFEAVFVATSSNAFRERDLVKQDISEEAIASLENDPEFIQASQQGTTQTVNVKTRLDRARVLLMCD